MPNTKQWRKLSKTPSHRKAMMRNMASSLLLHEKVRTTLPKAKELQRFVDRLLTHTKSGDLQARRYLSGIITDKNVQKKIFDILVKRYTQRPGGYTRIFKLGRRMSDGAPMGLVQLIP